ncbi:reverse transcriptase domain-containing protein [Nephila pilipes]|uniref:Reverse transcriptase domain-containing protein n=1 Tax=Nephila pilipes TaxID=299642 RepID=A0A8X6MXB1_NEPPI|nr:reverse transcriptase domain-containing protein [Nephila pilipes]
MFGVNVSPFLLSATIKHHIEKYREQYPAATELLDTCLYVDDVISGADDISQALKISKDADTIMKDASMKLRKWNSNDQALMKTWEYEGLETHPRHSENNSGVQSPKVLGIPWNVIHDYFTIDVKGLLELDTSKPVTKRIVLQSAGKIYDPVVFLSPYTIKLKCLLQELWLRKLAWDDELPPDIYATWLQWWTELPLLFIHNCRTRSAKIKGPLTSQEVSYAENWLIRSLHEKEFPEEMRKLLADPPSLPYPPSHPYQPVQSTLALPVKENRGLNQISKSIQVYVKLPSLNLPKISTFTMTMNTRNTKASRIQSGYSMKI